MANFFDKILVNFQSRSGVNLDYTPEDTLKSFIMEKRLAPITSDENAPNSVDSNSHNMRPAKSLKFYPTAQTCRPPPKVRTYALQILSECYVNFYPSDLWLFSVGFWYI